MAPERDERAARFRDGTGPRVLLALALASAAVLLSQVALTRVFSIAQGYHFAFLVVSLALLGFGASGSLLAVRRGLTAPSRWPWHAFGFGVTTVAGYAVLNFLPFDAYAIAWDADQVLLLVLNLVALAFPYAFAGALVASVLASNASRAGASYGATLLGSGAGAILAPAAIAWLGSERAIVACACLGALAAVLLAAPVARQNRLARPVGAAVGVASVLLIVLLPPALEVQPSPYQRLSQFRLDPDARVVATRQDERSRLDIVVSPTIHSARGLSVTYTGSIPPQAGLLLDADQLLPVPDASRTSPELGRSIPSAVAHRLRPEAEVLLLGSGGGGDALAALHNGARRVTVVEPDRLVHEVLTVDLAEWAGLAGDPRTDLVHDDIRAYAERRAPGAADAFDIVELTLDDPYRPIGTGALSLTEDYTLTVEALRAYLRLCGEDGLFTASRWVQSPPSESLRMLALIAEALRDRELSDHVIAFRSFQTVTFLVKATPFSTDETERALAEVDRLRYDVVLAPRIPPRSVDRYARTGDPLDHRLAVALATTSDRAAFYETYDFDVRPTTDDRPFFFHFFRPGQTSDLLANLGRRWQAFGGAGIFVLIGLLVFAVTAALAFVVAPIALAGRFRTALRDTGLRLSTRVLAYFTAIGLAFLLVEVALIQRFILVVGHPTLAVATVVGSVLFASGIGSAVSHRLPRRTVLLVLVALLVVLPFAATLAAPLLLGLPSLLRAAAVALIVAPVGFLMGMPFPRGIAELEGREGLVPWAWAANGSASVISGVLAALVALGAGFTPVLLAGAALYLVAAALAPLAPVVRRMPARPVEAIPSPRTHG